MATPLTDRDIERLQSLLDALPATLEPLDVCALDGFLCGLALQPSAPDPARWQPFVTDTEGRAAPPAASAKVEAIVRIAHSRLAELQSAIDARQWFDPWLFALEPDDLAEDSPLGAIQASVLPWVAGFALALEHFPAALQADGPRAQELIEPLALLYLHFDPDDLEAEEALLAAIEEIEPPATMEEATEDVVRAVLLWADVTRPRAQPQPQARPQPRAARRPHAGTPGGTGRKPKR